MDDLLKVVAGIEAKNFRWSALYYKSRGLFRIAVHYYTEQGQHKTAPVFAEFGSDIEQLSRQAADVVEKLEADHGHEAATT